MIGVDHDPETILGGQVEWLEQGPDMIEESSIFLVIDGTQRPEDSRIAPGTIDDQLAGRLLAFLGERESVSLDERDENGHVIGAFTDQPKACHHRTSM